MEKKELSMIILGIVAVIAVVGLVLLFKSVMTGDVVRVFPPSYTYSNVQEDPWPYARGTYKGGVTEMPDFTDGYLGKEDPGVKVDEGTQVFGTGEGMVYRDWNRRREPELAYVSQKGICNALARLGVVPLTHTWGATYTDAKEGRLYNKKCVKAPEGTGIPFCCTPPSSTEYS